VRNWVIRVDGRTENTDPAPVVDVYPRPGAADVFQDAVPKASFSEPVRNMNRGTFTLVDAAGARVPGSVHQIGDGTWGLFPDQVFLKGGAIYTARVAAGVCGYAGNCTTKDLIWRFTVTSQRGGGAGDTTIPMGFAAARERGATAIHTNRRSPSP